MTTATTLEEQAKATVRAMHDAFNRHDLEAALEFIAPDARNHGEVVGREGYMFVWRDILTRSPDVSLEIIDLVAEGERVVARAVYSGSFAGPRHIPVDGGFLVGLEPNNRPFSVQHIHMYRVRDGLIAEHHACRDDLEMMNQLGLPLEVPPRGV